MNRVTNILFISRRARRHKTTAPVPNRAMSRSPNILFIMSDDHASHALSCYGSRINRTPNLDRIAARGMRFDNCFCTNSICTPSRATILTGTYNHVNGVTTLATLMDKEQRSQPGWIVARMQPVFRHGLLGPRLAGVSARLPGRRRRHGSACCDRPAAPGARRYGNAAPRCSATCSSSSWPPARFHSST